MNGDSRQMNPGCKVVLWILGIGLLGLVVLAVFVGPTVYEIWQGMTRDPAEVEAIARNISPYELPDGFSGKMGLEYERMRMATLQAGSIMLTLVQRPAGAGEALPDGVEDQVPTRSDRGEETPVTIELTDGRTFEGVRGPPDGEQAFYSFQLDEAAETTLILMGPEEVLTEDRVREILGSMK